jgi:hypothetical protein
MDYKSEDGKVRMPYLQRILAVMKLGFGNGERVYAEMLR